MAAAPLIVDIERLDRDGETFTGTVPAEVLELDHNDALLFEPAGDIAYNLFVERLGDELLVRGSISQPFHTTCVRCTCSFDWESSDRNVTFSVEIAGAAFVDLTSELREGILIGLPNHPLCRLECRGLCPWCGIDLNRESCSCQPPVEDRWGALDQLGKPGDSDD